MVRGGGRKRNSQVKGYKLAPFRGDDNREILFATPVNRAIFQNSTPFGSIKVESGAICYKHPYPNYSL